MPLATLEAFAEHGEPRDALTGTEDDARRTLGALQVAGIDLVEVGKQLLIEGLDAFAVAMSRLLESIERRRS